MSPLDDLTKENQQLQLAVNELTILNDIATTISSTQPVDAIIDQVVMKCIKHLRVEEGTISLLERDTREHDLEFHTMVRRQDLSTEKVPIKLDDRLKGWMLNNRSVLLSNNIRDDERFHFLDENSCSFRSILCVPLVIKGALTGYLAVFNKKGDQSFTEEDRRLLSIIGSQSAHVIENARLYEEEKALLGLQEEIRMARDIQLNLLPDHTPESPGFKIVATNMPARLVGGDYYDFVTLSHNRIGFCVGDITGKGMPAALLMANLQATFRSQVMNTDKCDICLKHINTLLFNSTESTKFATFFYGILDPENNTLNYANGGHDPPILFKKGREPELLTSTGLLLGAMEVADYSEATLSLAPDDMLLLYTDGITEAMNPLGQEFGLEKMMQIAYGNRQKSPDDILRAILHEVQNHAEQAPQSDDITLLIIKVDN